MRLCRRTVGWLVDHTFAATRPAVIVRYNYLGYRSGNDRGRKLEGEKTLEGGENIQNNLKNNNKKKETKGKRGENAKRPA